MDDLLSFRIKKDTKPEPTVSNVNWQYKSNYPLDNACIKSIQSSQNVGLENSSQPYFIFDTHPSETDINGEVIEEFIVVKDEENCIDIDEMHIKDIEQKISDVTELNSEVNKTRSINLSKRKLNATDRGNISKDQNSTIDRKGINSNKKFEQTSKARIKTGVCSKRKRKTPNAVSWISTIKFKSNASKALSTMQILPRRDGQFSKAEKDLALSLFYKSPSTYQFLQNQNIVLPSIDTIRIWIGNIDCNPGLSPILLSQIKHKVSTMEDKDKECILVFASIQINGIPEYRVNGIPPEKRQQFDLTDREWYNGTSAIIFVLKGIYSNWSLPLAYFIGGKDVPTICRYLIMSVKNALSSGLVVCGVFGDLDFITKFPLVLEALGATPDKPYFLVENVKIFTLLNIFSIFELIKYQWSFNDFLFCEGRVSLQVVVDTFKCKLTETDGKKTVSDLPPIFCRTTSSLIKQVIKNGQINSCFAKDTAGFVKCLANLYQVLNKKDFDASGFLFIMIKTLNKLRKGVYNATKPSDCVVGLPVFKHLETLVRAIVMFCDEYKPKMYPNLVMECHVIVFIQKLFLIGDKDLTIETLKNQFRESFVNSLMQPSSKGG